MEGHKNTELMEQIVVAGTLVRKENLLDIVDTVKDFAVYKGMCLRRKDQNYDERVIIPFCLLPSSFPEKWFYYAKSLQKDVNYVLHQVAYSPDFLRQCLKGVLHVDEFVSKIFDIYERLFKEQTQVSLGLFRTDYMLDTSTSGFVTGIKQIETNTISTSFSGLASNVVELHKLVLGKLGLKDLQQKLPENNATVSMANGLVSAWQIYGNKNAVILVVIERKITNICDQRATEFSIYALENQIKIIRCTFTEIRKNASLKDNKLFVGKEEVAVVYYRTGYVPDNYEDEDWDTRFLMEKSQAIKCPSAGYHLAGTKTVQLNLLLPGVLEQFLPKNSEPEKLRSVFAQQFSLEKGPKGDEAIELALSNPQQFVLKPEREGGGNNVYGDDIKVKLQSIQSSEERQAYLLMEKINAPKVCNCLIRPSYQPDINHILCELGIYGVIIGSKDKIHHNWEAGHIIRSKDFKSQEGGIVAGFGALDSPLLV